MRTWRNGIRASLRCWFSHGLGGSSPLVRTTKTPTSVGVFVLSDNRTMIKFLYMKKQKIVLRVFETYLRIIENSVGSKMFRTLIADVDGRRTDVLHDGELSCAVFVSSILKLVGLMPEVRATVTSTVADLEAAGWKRSRTPQQGDIIVWEEKQFADESHRHIGFYMGEEMAISNSFKRKVPMKHHWMCEKNRQVELILHYPKSMQSLLKKKSS